MATSLRHIEDKSTWNEKAGQIAALWVSSRLNAPVAEDLAQSLRSSAHGVETKVARPSSVSKTESRRTARSGVLLWRLVETLDGGAPVAVSRRGKPLSPAPIALAELDDPTPHGTRARLEASANLQRAFERMATLGITTTVSARDLATSEPTPAAVLAVIFALTRHAMATEGNARRLSVLRWAARRAAGKSHEDDVAMDTSADDDEADMQAFMTHAVQSRESPVKPVAAAAAEEETKEEAHDEAAVATSSFEEVVESDDAAPTTSDDEGDHAAPPPTARAPRAEENKEPVVPPPPAPVAQQRRRSSEPASPRFRLRNLDTDDVVEATPHSGISETGIVGDDETQRRHQTSLELWSKDVVGGSA